MNPSGRPSGREASGTDFSDRRRETRRPASGRVTFVRDQLPAHEFEGELVEMSDHGMRFVHNCVQLERGMRIRFRHPHRHGTAIAVWNRRNGKNVESGFLVED